MMKTKIKNELDWMIMKQQLFLTWYENTNQPINLYDKLKESFNAGLLSGITLTLDKDEPMAKAKKAVKKPAKKK